MTRSAYDYGLDLLSARSYTVRNLRRKMQGKGFEAADIDAAIERLTAAGLVDDRKYAYEFARQKVIVGGASIRRARQAMITKGIASAVADDAIAQLQVDEPVDQSAAMERAALKKLRSMTDADTVAMRRRLFGFLARKGYELDDIKRVVARLIP